MTTEFGWVGWVQRPIDVAYHEAAHIVATFKLGMPLPLRASVISDEQYFGWIVRPSIRPLAEPVSVSEEPGLLERYFVRNVICALSGYAANFHRKRISRVNSYSRVRQFLEQSSVGYVDATESHDVLIAFAVLRCREADEEKRKELLRDVWQITGRYVGAWWLDIKYVAGVLLERKELDSKGLSKYVFGQLSPLTNGRDDRWIGRNLDGLWGKEG